MLCLKDLHALQVETARKRISNDNADAWLRTAFLFVGKVERGRNKGASKARLAIIKRFFACALAILLAGSALAGIIALKTVIYVGRLNF
jgi:hypothetical protein